MSTSVMTKDHPRWDEFIGAMMAMRPEQCRVNTAYARHVLAEMGDVDVEASLSHLANKGGSCDCEIVMNVLIPFMEEFVGESA